MKVCLIGNGLTTLSLGKNLINKKIKVFNYTTDNKTKARTRTIGISKDNLDFFNKEIIQLKKNMTWDIKKINIYTEKYKDQKIFNFEETTKNLFSMFKNSEVEEYLEKKLKKNKLFKKILIKNDQSLKKVINMNFDLIINCDANNIIAEEFFLEKLIKIIKAKHLLVLLNIKKL